MRFDKRITFVNETDSYYDPLLGGYVEGEVIETVMPCNLSNLGVTRSNELFGQIDKVVIIARLQRPYIDKIDYALVNDQKYRILRKSDYRKGVFYLESSNG